MGELVSRRGPELKGPTMYVDRCRTAIERAATTLALDDAVRAIYQGVIANLIGEGEADTLQALANARRMALKGPLAGSKPFSVRPTIFPPKRPTPRYDRSAARQRRRGHSRDRWMPDHLADHFTDGELAALTIVAMEYMKHGRCDLTIGEIAAFAGVCERTVRYAFKAAENMEIVSIERVRPVGQKNLPNVVRITSPEWLKWIERRPVTRRGRIGCKKMQPSSQKGKNLPLTPSFRAHENRRKGYRKGAVGQGAPDSGHHHELEPTHRLRT